MPDESVLFLVFSLLADTCEEAEVVLRLRHHVSRSLSHVLPPRPSLLLSSWTDLLVARACFRAWARARQDALEEETLRLARRRRRLETERAHSWRRRRVRNDETPVLPM